MRILVYEYITGGGMLDSALPSSLAREGDLMLRALVSDLTEIEGIEVVATRDKRLGSANLPSAEFRLLQGPEDFPLAWQECLETVEAVWPIAPEHFQILEGISESVLAKGKLLLNSPPCAVQTTTSKLATSTRLRERGVATVPTYRLEDLVSDNKGSWVLKPDDGVGCLGARICRDLGELHQQYRAVGTDRCHVVQPFVHGTPVSLNILAHEGEAFVLSVNRQRIAMADNSFVLLGCVVNGYPGQPERFHKIGQDVVSAFPELWGIIGVDMIDTDSGLQVLEVNPRLTTSYVGLRESTGVNPAALVLDLLKGKRPTAEQFMNAATVVDVDLEYAGAA